MVERPSAGPVALAVPAGTEAGDAASRPLGVALLLFANFFFAISGVFTKLITAGTWTILGWRGLVGGFLVMLYVLAMQKRAGRPLSLSLGRRGWLVAFVSAGASVMLIAAFKLTTVAKVTVIYATVPFMAAVVAYFALRTRLRPRTLLASLVSFGGVALAVGLHFDGGHLTGDLLALGMTAACAVYLVMIRAFADTPTVWASGVAAFILVPLALVLGDFSTLSGRDMMLMTVFGASFAAAIILWTEGAKLLPPSEAGLMGTAELPMAVGFAWLLLGEVPGAATFAGGLLVLGAVTVHAAADLRRGPVRA